MKRMEARWRQAVMAIVLLVFLDLALYCGYLLYQQELRVQALKLDRAELSHAKYGLLSVDAWEERLTAVVEKKVEEFEISGEGREEMRQRIEGLIAQMIDTTAEVIRTNHAEEGGVSGWFKQNMFNVLVDVDSLKDDAPTIAESFMRYLDEPENRDRIKGFVGEQIRKYARETMGETDFTRHRAILARYGAADSEAAVQEIDGRLETARFAVDRLALILLVATLPLVGALWSRRVERGVAISLLLILAVALLYLGVASPMIDIDARVGTLSFQLAGETMAFHDQVLFFQSKSIIEVVRILLSKGDAKLALVGGLILLFSVLFPLTKMLFTAVWLSRPKVRARNHPLVHFFVFKSGKWSMADVMVVAVFMAYLGFAGVMDSQLKQLERDQGHLQVLTTSSSELQIGFYLFTAFCLLGLLISQMAAEPNRETDLDP